MDKQTRRLWILSVLFGIFVLTVAGVYTVSEWKLVQRRKAMIESWKAPVGARYISLFPYAKLRSGWRWQFLVRHWMGDREAEQILLKEFATDDEVARCRDAFPEAKVIKVKFR